MRGKRSRVNGWHCEHCDDCQPMTRADEKRMVERKIADDRLLQCETA